MKITPLEIRQKVFEKRLRGYDKDEVNAFLQSLSKEWERSLDELKEVRIRLEGAEKEVQKLREVESSLFKTLKTAEDTGANVIEQANKSAELHLKETQIKADALLNEAKVQARDLIERAETEAAKIADELLEEIRTLEETYKLIEQQKENLASQLKNISKDTLERVEKLMGSSEDKPLKQLFKKAKETARKIEDYNGAEEIKQAVKEEQESGDTSIEEDQGSFFDKL
jgi:cell division initiation protein